MTIETACPNCGKQYRASAEMSGRRVKCRECDTVFALGGDPAAAAAPGGEPGAGRNGASPAGELSPDVASAFHIPKAQRLGRPAGDDPDAVFADAFAEYRPAVRPNYGHNFPYAGLIDRWLPTALVAASAVWLVAQTIGSNDSAGWAIPLRLGLAAAGYLLVVYPLGRLGLSLGCRYAKFQQPPDPAKRVVAATLFPYALLLAIWLMAGTVGGAAPGLFVALVVAVGLAWLAYRPAPDEAAVSLTAAGGAFLAAVIACGLLAVGANEAARAIARSNGPPALAASPVGPGLAWDAPPPPPPDKPVKKLPAGPALVDGSPADDGPASGTSAPGVAPTPPAPINGSPTAVPGPAAPDGPVATVVPPRPGNPAEYDPLGGSKLFGTQSSATRPTTVPTNPPPTDSAPTPPEPGVATVPPGVTPAPPEPPGGIGATPAPVVPTGDPVVDQIRSARSSFVAEARPVGAIRPFARAVFPLTPSPAALFARAGDDGGDAVEVWDLARFELVGAVRATRDETGDAVSGNYALSPDGRVIARVTRFPTYGVELVPVGPPAASAGPPPPGHVPFPPKTLTDVGTAAVARLVGFAGPGKLVVRWQVGENAAVQGLDARTWAFTNPVKILAHPPTAGNQAVSPDGRLYAAVGTALEARTGLKKAHVALFDVARNVPVRAIPIPGDAQWADQPTGLAFAPDGRRLGVLYEQGGKAFVIWVRTDVAGGAGGTTLVPSGQVPPAPGPPAGGRLVATPDGRSWVVGGNAVVDNESLRATGELGSATAADARTAGDAVFLIHGAGTDRKLVLVKPVARVPARPATGPSAQPLTRPTAAAGGAGR